MLWPWLGSSIGLGFRNVCSGILDAVVEFFTWDSIDETWDDLNTTTWDDIAP